MKNNGTPRKFLDFNDWISYVFNSVLESKYQQIYVEPLKADDE